MSGMQRLAAGSFVAAFGVLVISGLLQGDRWTGLGWNVLLAAVPVVAAAAAVRWRRRPIALVGAATIWFAFLPNAPYLVTDVVHLDPAAPRATLAADIVVVTVLAAAGLVFGAVSLGTMRRLALQRLAPERVRLLLAAVLAADLVGVYLGRRLRLNSWEIVSDPARIADAVRDALATPLGQPETLLLSLAAGIALPLAFGVLRAAEEAGSYFEPRWATNGVSPGKM